jgi:cell division protein FtsB
MRLRKSYFSAMVKPAPTKRKVKWVRYALLTILGLGIYHILSGPSGALNLVKLRRLNAGQARELDSLTIRRAELEIEKGRLQKDSAYIEKVARKELGMAKKGEKVFRFMGSTDPNGEKPKAIEK